MTLSIPPGAFVDPHWQSVIPPYYSNTHPTITLILPHTSRITIKAPRLPMPAPSRPMMSDNDFPPLPSSSRAPSSPHSQGASEVRASVSAMWKRPSSISQSQHPSTSSLISRIDEQGKTDLDRFATSYTPLWLRQLPPPSQVIPLPPSPPFPPNGYAERLYPKHLLEDALPINRICPSILSQAPVKETLRPLDADRAITYPQYYANHFSHLLSLYLLGQIQDMEKALVHMVPLHLEQNSDIPGTYRLHIPGIREDSPRLAIGDKLLLRGLYTKVELPSMCAVEAEVVGLAKGRGWVYVRSPSLEELDQSLPKHPQANGAKPASLYQIRFLTSAAPVCAMQDGVRTFGLLNQIGWLIARRWLFPYVSDVQNNVRREPPAISWVDQALNEEQKAAVCDIVSGESNIPYLISGPPGVSKTKLLVEAVLQVIESHQNAAILVCAPSNPAADTVSRRLARTLRPGEMLRLNAPIRTFAEVSDELLPYCHVVDDQFDLPSFDELMRYRVVVTTCTDAHILVAAHATNSSMMRAQSELHSAFHPFSKSHRTILPHWTHLLIDEAAQASEPETLIPLSVVVPYPLPEGYESKDPVVVLCGDIHQLGPIIPSEQARAGDLDVSLLERLFERDVYASHPAAREHLNKGDSSSWPYPPPFSNLLRNYRSVPSILMVPATMFYDDTLIPAAQNISSLKWTGLPNPNIPILFRGCEAAEDWIEEGASWFNPGEVKLIVDLVKSLLNERQDIRQDQIAVITPWREQVWRARAALRAAGLGKVDVGNVETYQGGEFRVTIISCVRSRARFLPSDHEANMGLYHQRKRFNVAITRAKELLIVVGNANLLKGDPYWNGFLQIMLRNDLYRGPKVELEMTGAYISRLESAMRSNEKVNADEAVLLLAGAMARETLIEE